MTITEHIKQAVEVVRRGGVIACPTDTVWGLSCDATDSKAVQRIYKIKQRTDSKALITLVGSLSQLERWIDGIPDVAYDLIEAAVNPLTIVFDSARGLAPELLAPDGSVGVRLTTDPFCRGLCATLGRPIVSTSANISGDSAPALFSDIDPKIISHVDFVSEWRRDDSESHKPSTVIKLSADSTVKIIRP